MSDGPVRHDVGGWIVAAVAMVGAAVLLAWRLPMPFGGFHGWNEGWYGTLAQTFASGEYLLRPGQCGVPLGFAWTLGTAFLVGGVSEAVARFVCVVAYVGVLWETARWARRAGVSVPTTVALTASMPMSVFLAQNVQTDMWYVFLALLWWNTVEAARVRAQPSGVLAGFIGGIGWLVKPFILFYWAAAAALAVWRTWSIRWMFTRPVLIGTAVGLLTVTPYYIYFVVFRTQAAFGVDDNLALTTEIPSLQKLALLAIDLLWAVGPAVLLLACVGIVRGLLGRDPAILAVGMLGLAVCGAYWLLHYHTYYVAGIIPVVALGAAHSMAPWRRGVRTAVTLLLVCWGLGYTFVLLQAKEIGHTAFADAGRWIRAEAHGGSRVVMDTGLWGSFSPLINFYARPDEILSKAEAAAADPTEAPVFRIDPFNTAQPAPSAFVAYETRLIIRLGDATAYVVDPANIHVFQPPGLQPAPQFAGDGPRLERIRVPWIQVRRLRAPPR